MTTPKKWAICISVTDLDSYYCAHYLNKKIREGTTEEKFCFMNVGRGARMDRQHLNENMSSLVVLCGKINLSDAPQAFSARRMALVGEFDPHFVNFLKENSAHFDLISATENESALHQLQKWMEDGCGDGSISPSEADRQAAWAAHTDYQVWKTLFEENKETYQNYREKDSYIRDSDFSPSEKLPEEIPNDEGLKNAIIQSKNWVVKKISTHRKKECRTFGPTLELTKIPVGFAKFTMDALEFAENIAVDTNRDGQFARATLILLEADKKLKKLAFYGSKKLVAEISNLAIKSGFRVEPDKSRQFASHTGVFIDPDTPHTSSGRDEILGILADAIIDNVLSGNRPVERFRSHFFAAFDARSFSRWAPNLISIDGDIQTLENSTNDEKNYFLPELRDRLFGNGSSPLHTQSFEIKLEGDHKISVEHGNYADPLAFNLAAAFIHFNGNVALLEWVVEGDSEASAETLRKKILDAERERPNEKPESCEALTQQARSLWQQLLDSTGQDGDKITLSLAQVADFNAEGRFTHFTYRRVSVLHDGTPVETKITLHSKDENHALCLCPTDAPVSEKKAILHALLKPVYGKQTNDVLEHQLTDDRARVLTSMVLMGNPPHTKSGVRDEHILLSQINQVDPYSTGFSYSEAQGEKELAESSYDRFFGSHLMMTEHSFSFVGYRGGNRSCAGQQSEAPAELSYAEKYIHPDHMRGVYRRLFMHFLFLEAELRSISVHLTAIESRLDRRRSVIGHRTRNEISDLRHWMTLAGSNLRQRTLSTQIQGREITEKLEARFRLEPEWVALDAKIHALEAWVEDDAGRVAASHMNAFYFLGLPFAFVSFLLGIRPAGGTSVVARMKALVFGPDQGAPVGGVLDGLYTPVIWVQRLLSAIGWESEGAAMILYALLMAVFIWWVVQAFSRYRKGLSSKSY